MTSTEIFWVDGPWPGKLALSARPRGGEWLEDEIDAWRRAGLDTVFSLLTPEEETELDIADERSQARSRGMEFQSLPIRDRQVPDSDRDLAKALEKLDRELASGRNVVLHCRQGVGRAGLVAACLFLTKGLDPQAAVQRLSAARGVPIPETREQRQWIDRYSATLASAHK